MGSEGGTQAPVTTQRDDAGKSQPSQTAAPLAAAASPPAIAAHEPPIPAAAAVVALPSWGSGITGQGIDGAIPVHVIGLQPQQAPPPLMTAQLLQPAPTPQYHLATGQPAAAAPAATAVHPPLAGGSAAADRADADALALAEAEALASRSLRRAQTLEAEVQELDEQNRYQRADGSLE